VLGIVLEQCIYLARRVARIVSRLAASCECIMLSGGVDTTFIASVHPGREGLRAFTVGGGSDERYAVIASRVLGIRDHTVIRPSKGEVLDAAKTAAVILASVDPIEVAAGASHIIAFKAALGRGCSCIISGDGGDELFLGYDFLVEADDREVKEWLSKASSMGMWMPTVHLGRIIGVEVRAPLYSWEVRRVVLSAPLECLRDRRRKIGKLALRLYLEEVGLREIAWRPKDPVTRGSGVLSVLESESRKLDHSDVIEAYKFLGFMPPSRLHAMIALMLRDSRVRLPQRRYGRGSCPICGRSMREGVCRFCGAVITKRGVSVYTNPPP